MDDREKKKKVWNIFTLNNWKLELPAWKHKRNQEVTKVQETSFLTEKNETSFVIKKCILLYLKKEWNLYYKV